MPGHTPVPVERLFGLLACRYGARKSGYLGRRKAGGQASWVAAPDNLSPIGAALGAGRREGLLNLRLGPTPAEIA